MSLSCWIWNRTPVGTGWNAATMSELAGDNWCVSCGAVPIFDSPRLAGFSSQCFDTSLLVGMPSGSRTIFNRNRFWRIYIVPSEVLGISGCSAWCTACRQGHLALALPLFARKPPSCGGLVATTLPLVEQAFVFCGVGLSRMQPCCGEYSLTLLSKIEALFTSVFGPVDQLIPREDREAIGTALSKVDLSG